MPAYEMQGTTQEGGMNVSAILITSWSFIPDACGHFVYTQTHLVGQHFTHLSSIPTVSALKAGPGEGIPYTAQHDAGQIANK